MGTISKTVALMIFVAVVAVAGTWFLVAPDTGEAQTEAQGAQTIKDLQAQIVELQANQAPPILQCFNLREGDLQDKRARLFTDNFGWDGVVITQAFMMCEDAVKRTQDGHLGTATGKVWECYRLKEGNSPHKRAKLETRNFGVDRVAIGVSEVFCERARKTILPNDQDSVEPQ